MLKMRTHSCPDNLPNSCLYEGVIRHRRRTPVKNSFTFSAFMFFLDLDEVDDVFGRGLFWSNRRFAYASFCRADHLKQFSSERNLKDCVRELLLDSGVEDEIGRVCLLTQLSYFGFRMNPVSFYYCYRGGDDRLVAVVAEVNNTPWDEQHVYVIPDHEQQPSSPVPSGDSATSPADIAVASERRTPMGRQRYIKTEKLKKSFHVSPFMHTAMHYRMLYSLPDQKIGVKMENHEAGEKIFDVSMLMHKRSITKLRLMWMGIKYPVYSLKVFAGIHFQALKLYLKKVPVHPHPNRQSPTSV